MEEKTEEQKPEEDYPEDNINKAPEDREDKE